MRAYEVIADQVLVPDLTDDEREWVARCRNEKTTRYTQLVRILDEEGCKFPLVQAALMMRNMPAVANQLRDQHFGQVLD